DIALARYGLLVRDIIDLRISQHVHFALVMLEQLAKDLRGGNELRRGEVLTADLQHVMLGKGAVQRGAGFRVDALVQVNAAHFGAGMWGQRGNRVLHRAISSSLDRMRAASMASGARVWQYLDRSLHQGGRRAAGAASPSRCR